MKIFDVTTKHLAELYKKHKLMPLTGHARVEFGGCCALGILMVENGTPLGGGRMYTDCLPADIGVDDLELASFAAGFDGREIAPERAGSNERRAHEHGRKLGAILNNNALYAEIVAQIKGQ